MPGLLALLTFLSAMSFAREPVTLVANDWCPQQCEGDEKAPGYVVEVVTQALRAEGMPYVLKYLPWLRALKDVEQGQYDGLLGPTPRTYPQFAYHEEAVGYQEYCIYTRRGSDWKYKKPADLLGRRVALLKDSGLGELDSYLAENRARINVHEFAGSPGYTRQIFDFLEKDRTDSIIITSDVYFHAVKTKVIPDRFRSAGCLGQEKLAVGFSTVRRDRALEVARKLDAGIRKLRRSGQLRRILDKYGIPPWDSAP